MGSFLLLAIERINKVGTEVVSVADNFSPSAHRVADSFLIRERSLSSYCEVGV